MGRNHNLKPRITDEAAPCSEQYRRDLSFYLSSECLDTAANDNVVPLSDFVEDFANVLESRT